MLGKSRAIAANATNVTWRVPGGRVEHQHPPALPAGLDIWQSNFDGVLTRVQQQHELVRASCVANIGRDIDHLHH
ncbi:MAG: hypothetical protein ACRDJH_09350, partial [Thermomicrobiales bacterium]